MKFEPATNSLDAPAFDAPLEKKKDTSGVPV